jgi:hypothetical protein
MFMVANEKIHAKLRKSAQTAKYFASAPASATVDDDGGRNPGWLFPPLQEAFSRGCGGAPWAWLALEGQASGLVGFGGRFGWFWMGSVKDGG